MLVSLHSTFASFSMPPNPSVQHIQEGSMLQFSRIFPSSFSDSKPRVGKRVLIYSYRSGNNTCFSDMCSCIQLSVIFWNRLRQKDCMDWGIGKCGNMPIYMTARSIYHLTCAMEGMRNSFQWRHNLISTLYE